MLAHFMLFSEADIEYRFLLATNSMIKEETLKPLSHINEQNSGYFASRFHKISLGLVNAKNRKNKKSADL
jgi:hypothetical protein